MDEPGELNVRCWMKIRSNLLQTRIVQEGDDDVRYAAINESSHSETPVARQKVVAIACHKAQVEPTGTFRNSPVSHADRPSRT